MIETERLLLRRWRDDDAAAHNLMCSDAEVMRYLGPVPTPEASAGVIERQNALLDRYGCCCFWAVERRTDRKFIGWCGVKPGPDHTPIAGEPEIGWSLTRDCWGHGYAREAAAAALAFAWDRLDAPQITAITTPDNVRSWGLMERLGMRRVVDGDFDHPELAADDPLRRHIVYRIDRPA